MTRSISEELLRNTAWMRRLARSLVRDDFSADEVTQRALVLALQRPPTRADSLRGWLRTIVRNVAYRLHRDETRRRDWESSACRESSVPSPGELAEHVELHRLVSQLVLGLREPYRSTVILRYFEDLTAREIADRQGVPPATVRSRIRRALSELKESLEVQFGEDGSEWRTAIAPLAMPAGLSATGKTSATAVTATNNSVANVGATFLTGAAATMSQKPLLVAGCISLFALTAGVSLWRLSSGSESAKSAPAWKASPEYASLAAQLKEARNALSSAQSLLVERSQENVRLRSLLSHERQNRLASADRSVEEPDRQEQLPASFVDLADFATFLKRHIQLVGRRNERDTLDGEQLATLDLFYAELLRASAAARAKYKEPFFEPEFFKSLWDSMLAVPLKLDNDQRVEFEALMDEATAALPGNVDGLLPLEKHELRQHALDEIFEGMDSIVRPEQSAAWDVLREFSQETLASRTEIVASIDAGTDEVMTNWAANGLGANWKDLPIEEIRPLAEGYLSRARSTVGEYAPDDASLQSLDEGQRAELEERLLRMQLQLEKQILGSLDEEVHDKFLRRSPMVLRFRYARGLMARGGRSHF